METYQYRLARYRYETTVYRAAVEELEAMVPRNLQVHQSPSGDGLLLSVEAALSMNCGPRAPRAADRLREAWRDLCWPVAGAS